MEHLSADINDLFRRMKPILRSMEHHREEVVSKFRPLLMVFAAYAMVCFLLPYMDFGLPRNLRGNMFYFLLTIGGLSFSVVIAIYFRAYKELQSTVTQKFYHGLSKQLGEGFQFVRNAPGYDAHLANDMWGQAYNHFEARNLIHGAFGTAGFSFAQISVHQREMDSLQTDKQLFQGLILTLELTQRSDMNGIIIGKSHPSYSRINKKGRALITGDEKGVIPRYYYFSGDDMVPETEFTESLLQLDDALRSQRVMRQGQELILVFRNGLLMVAIPVYDRLWELVNWKPFENIQFLSRQLLPFRGALKLAQSV